MMNSKKVDGINIKNHLIWGFALRGVLIIYGYFHDDIFNVPYTDVDYKVFTDASRHVLEGNSPYDRHTYRYSPLLAYLLIPNVVFEKSFGKWLFSLFDLLVGVIIYYIVKYNYSEYDKYRVGNSKKTDCTPQIENNRQNLENNRKNPKKNKKSKVQRKKINQKHFNFNPVKSSLIWLYNPLVIVISTRGNCDAIAGFLVLLSLFLLVCKKSPFSAGLIHGLSIHFRLYPLMYSLAYFMYLSNYSFYSTNYRLKNIGDNKKIGKNIPDENKKQPKKSNKTLIKLDLESKNPEEIKRTIFKKEYFLYLVPNLDQLKLVLGTFLSLSLFTGLFYYLYGYTFLHETYIYHFIRKDTRHNFSLYFYMQYLSAGVKNIGYWQGIITVLPQYTLILILSVRYGLNRVALNFALLTITFVMITFNTVLTSQYFTWLMVLLPLCLWQIKMPKRLAYVLIIAWGIAQIAWLLPAYLLEFEGQNTFIFIWIQGVSFFCANIGFLGRAIVYFMPGDEN